MSGTHPPCPVCGHPGVHLSHGCLNQAVRVARRLYDIVADEDLDLEPLVRDLRGPDWDWLRRPEP